MQCCGGSGRRPEGPHTMGLRADGAAALPGWVVRTRPTGWRAHVPFLLRPSCTPELGFSKAPQPCLVLGEASGASAVQLFLVAPSSLVTSAGCGITGVGGRGETCTPCCAWTRPLTAPQPGRLLAARHRVAVPLVHCALQAAVRGLSGHPGSELHPLGSPLPAAPGVGGRAVGFRGREGLESGWGRASLPQASPLGPAGQACRQLQPKCQAAGHGQGSPPAAGQGQRDVWVGLAATGRKLPGPQVSVNHGAGQMPGPGSGSLSRLPALSGLASRLQTPHQPWLLSWAVSGRFPSMLLFLPAFPVPLTHLPSSPCALPSSLGLERRTLGKPRQVGPGRGRAPPGPFLPKAASWTARERAAPRGQDGLQNWTAARKAARRPQQREQHRCYGTKLTTVCPGHAAVLGGWEPDRRGPGSSAGPAMRQPLDVLLLKRVTDGGRSAWRGCDEQPALGTPRSAWQQSAPLSRSVAEGQVVGYGLCPGSKNEAR